jgi:hypothetical protein
VTRVAVASRWWPDFARPAGERAAGRNGAADPRRDRHPGGRQQRRQQRRHRQLHGTDLLAEDRCRGTSLDLRAAGAKYPHLLNSKPPHVSRADLGAKGVFYRAVVGPFASASEANSLCNGLKAAGGQCVIQKN